MFKSSSSSPSRRAVRGAAVAAGLLAAFTTTAATIVPASAATRTAAAVSEKPPKGSVNIFETGSTLLYPLFQLWSAAYHKQYPNIKVVPSGTGSGAGISDASDGIVDIGASDAYLSGTQVSQHPGLLNIALAISAQQINYNVPGLQPGPHQAQRPGALGHLPGQDHHVERPGHRQAEPDPQPAGGQDHRPSSQ